MTLLDELTKESIEKKRRKRQASQGQPYISKVGVVAIYALCDQNKTPLTKALHICKQNGWLQPVEYVDWHIPGDHEPSMYRHCMGDISEGLIQVLVTVHAPQLERYCAQFGCKVIGPGADI
jgi:hypothetical protein